MVIACVGLGLMGGSLGLAIQRTDFAHHRIGVEASSALSREALDLGLVDEILPFEEACARADTVVLAVPVGVLIELLPRALDAIEPGAVVTDLGSTKRALLKRVENHSRRGRFVASHPMTGTEFSGPSAAQSDLYTNKTTILCETQRSDPDARKRIEAMYQALSMKIIRMEDAAEHDLHAAYVSHLSHVSSFALALTVLEKERDDAAIFNMAAGGFRSTVRLAKSSPHMWADVFDQNADPLVDVLDLYIAWLQKFREGIAQKDYSSYFDWIVKANRIAAIIDREGY